MKIHKKQKNMFLYFLYYLNSLKIFFYQIIFFSSLSPYIMLFTTTSNNQRLFFHCHRKFCQLCIFLFQFWVCVALRAKSTAASTREKRWWGEVRSGVGSWIISLVAEVTWFMTSDFLTLLFCWNQDNYGWTSLTSVDLSDNHCKSLRKSQELNFQSSLGKKKNLKVLSLSRSLSHSYIYINVDMWIYIHILVCIRICAYR